MDDTKLSHLASTDLFHPLTRTRHVTVCGCVVVCVLCWVFFCFGSFFGVFCLLSVFWVVVSALNVIRDLDYVSVLYQLLLRPLQLICNN